MRWRVYLYVYVLFRVVLVGGRICIYVLDRNVEDDDVVLHIMWQRLRAYVMSVYIIRDMDWI